MSSPGADTSALADNATSTTLGTGIGLYSDSITPPTLAVTAPNSLALSFTAAAAGGADEDSGPGLPLDYNYDYGVGGVIETFAVRAVYHPATGSAVGVPLVSSGNSTIAQIIHLYHVTWWELALVLLSLIGPGIAIYRIHHR